MNSLSHSTQAVIGIWINIVSKASSEKIIYPCGIISLLYSNWNLILEQDPKIPDASSTRHRGLLPTVAFC